MAEGVVLKPASDERFATWHADVMDAIEERDFRVASPGRADNGGWVVSGWTASTWIPGRQANRWAVLPPAFLEPLALLSAA